MTDSSDTPIPKPPAPKRRDEHCGCIYYDHADGRTEITPCLPHGLQHAAKGLALAAESFSTISKKMILDAEVAAKKAKGPQIII